MSQTADSNLPVQDVIRHLTHELRQPLSALESIAYYLQMTVGGGGCDVSAQVNRLQQMVDNANWILSDVLHLLQMPVPNPVRVDIIELVEDVLTESWVGDGLDICREFEEDLPAAWVDEEQLRHLLRSVLQFLRRTVDESGFIEISARGAANSLLIEFHATTPSVVAESLFSPLAPNQLFTCRRIAESNGGHFKADMDNHGQLCLQLAIPVAAMPLPLAIG